MQDQTRLLNTLECLLFAAKEPISAARLAEVLEIDVTEIPGLLAQLGEARTQTGLAVAHLAGGHTLTTRPEYADYVARLLQPDPERLSIQALETLAIIAYRQPITRPEIDEIRGVNSSGAVTSLIEKNLVRISGRKDAPGKPFLLEITPHFLSVFGLGNLSDLPDISELRRAMELQGLEAKIMQYSENDIPETEASEAEAGILDDTIENEPVSGELLSQEGEPISTPDSTSS